MNGGPFNAQTVCGKPERNPLSHELILQETALLLHCTPHGGLTIDDLEIDRDGMLTCKVLSVNGRIAGGINLTDSLMAMTLSEFSRRALVPWLMRMARLKSLQADLRALGVEI